MKTYTITTEKAIKQRRWYLVDANGKILGRLASALAFHLRGKHKVEFTPHIDTGDCFVVVNVEKIRVTGTKRINKKYHRHSGYPGGLKTAHFSDVLKQHPERILMQAVKGMLPRGPLGRQMLKKLKLYAGVKHPHQAQEPRPLIF